MFFFFLRWVGSSRKPAEFCDSESLKALSVIHWNFDTEISSLSSFPNCVFEYTNLFCCGTLSLKAKALYKSNS